MAKAVTDPARIRRKDPGNPAICNIYALHVLMSDNKTLKDAHSGCVSAQIGCVDCKNIISENIIKILSPIQEKKQELTAKGLDYTFDVLREGGKRARKIISATVEEVKDKMGVPTY